MRTLFCDVETYSSVDLIRCGAYRYAESPDFEILLLGYAFDDDPVKVIDLACGEAVPDEVMDALWSKDVEKVAHNANFERTTLGCYFGRYCPPEQWFDTMVLASSCGLPLSLEAVGQALGFNEDRAKMSVGKQLIRYFSVPCKPTKKNGGRTRNLPEHAPEDWSLYKDYNQRDVETEREIYRELIRWRPSHSEHRLWCLDQRINDRGIRVDKQLAENAIRIGDNYKAKLTTEATELSGLVNPNSTAQVKMWLEEQEGLTVPSLNKKVIADVIAQLSDGNAKRFMSLRSEFSKSSVKKYEAITRSVCDDEHIHGCFQFAGAGRTGRWAGRLVQLQNLSKNEMPDIGSARWLVREGDEETLRCVYPNVTSTLSELVRTALIPEEGHRFIIADYSAIEARVLAWIAGEDWRLKVFEDGGDIYCASASQMFKVPVVKHGINGHLRQKGKIAELACIAQGQLVLTDKGLVPIELVTTDMRVWDGEEWAEHDGVVCRGIKEVLTYDGLTATADHIVWVNGEERPVPFGYAAASGARLTVTGSGRREKKELADYTGTARVYDIRNAGRHNRYTVSGVLVHNCGYGGGVNALKAFGADKVMTEEEMAETIDHWRAASPRITALWKSVEKAAVRCVVRREPVMSTVGHILFEYEDGVMWMTLPSGRRIAYWGMQYTENPKRLGKSLSYMGLNQTTRRWERTETWGGKLVENCWAAGTEVLTHRGWISIEKIRLSDTLWDGARWVTHEGVIARPPSKVVELNGCLVTPSHKVLTEEGWIEVYKCNGLYGASVQLPHGISPRAGHRQNRQRERLFSAKLPMGVSQRKLLEPAWKPLHTNTLGADYRGRSLRTVGYRRNNITVPSECGRGTRLVVCATGRTEPVYDIANAGAGHRYLVRLGDGVVVAHNCTQATARDCLKETMLALHDEGYDIRAHVHDEVIITEPIDGRTVDDVCAIMGRELPWAKGLPLRGDGYYGDEYYFKD